MGRGDMEGNGLDVEPDRKELEDGQKPIPLRRDK